MAEQKITKEMTIAEIFERFPSHSMRLAQEMTNFGLHCASCSASSYETLEIGVLGHGMDLQTLEKLIENLNKIIEKSIDPTTITLTEKAADKYKSILESENKKDWGLRLEEKPSGCDGFEYVLDFSPKAKEDDIIFLSRGIEIHVQKKSEKRLIGSIIDYTDGLQGAGFKISNPNVKSSCSCGTSHGY